MSLSRDEPTRSPSLTVRERYITDVPGMLKHGFPPRRPDLPVYGRPLPRIFDEIPRAPPARYTPLGDTSAPSLDDEENYLRVQTDEGVEVQYDVKARIDKGFELSNDQWLCYRRNYFSLVAHFTMNPPELPTSCVVINGSYSRRVYQFGMSLTAETDRHPVREVELVQLTTKRDKGPIEKPDIIPVVAYNSVNPRNPFIRDMDGTQIHSTANFERIQFKTATQNNGKRRAAQEFYRLGANLMAAVDDPTKPGQRMWVKVASKLTGPLVVRGRSPGHYRVEERTDSPAPAMMPVPQYPYPYQYQYQYPYYQHPYQLPQLNLQPRAPLEVDLTPDEINAINATEGYTYYPRPLLAAVRREEKPPEEWGAAEATYLEWFDKALKLSDFSSTPTSKGYFPPLKVAGL